MLLNKSIFNPSGNDDINNRKIVDGSTTNLIQLNSTKYKWAIPLYDRMVNNYWIPQKIDLNSDINDYNNLTNDEVIAYESILSFLIFLDSIQLNNLPNINSVITAPEVNICLSVQGFQESIHAHSYQYIIETILPKEKRDKIYDIWRTNKILLERNKYIANIYQEFIDNKNGYYFFRVLIANYLLESIYFYSGFQFFYTLASRNLMSGTADIIRIINRDELSHVYLFQKIITEYIKEINNTDYSLIVNDLFINAIEQEINWVNNIIGDKILGMNSNSNDIYIKHLANQRLEAINFNPLFTEEKYTRSNPYQHLQKSSDSEGQGDVKTNFFESNTTAYQMSSSVKNWDF